MSAEVIIELLGVDCSAAGEEFVTEIVCYFAIEETALEKGLESVCVEHFCPLITVISCGITAVHDVSEYEDKLYVKGREG